MGSVADAYTTGDNDPEIEPESYHRHYLYCDGCGSFDLEYWKFAGDAAVRAPGRWLDKVAIIVVPIMVVDAALTLLGAAGWVRWMVWTAMTLFVVGRLLIEVTSSHGRLAGMRCRQCMATYAYGSAFFTDLDANPRQLKVGDVPRPLGRSPFLRGKSLPENPDQ